MKVKPNTPTHTVTYSWVTRNLIYVAWKLFRQSWVKPPPTTGVEWAWLEPPEKSPECKGPTWSRLASSLVWAKYKVLPGCPGCGMSPTASGLSSSSSFRLSPPHHPVVLASCCQLLMSSTTSTNIIWVEFMHGVGGSESVWIECEGYFRGEITVGSM